MRQRRLCVLVASLCLSVVATASPAVADCGPPRSALTALKQSDLVFRGEVRDVETAGERTWHHAPFPRLRRGWIVTLDVSRVWKGHVDKRFVLHIAQAQEDDAFESFERGSEYLVFAQRNSPQKTALFGLPEPTYGATGCGGTMSLLTGMRYLIDLGPGAIPK